MKLPVTLLLLCTLTFSPTLFAQTNTSSQNREYQKEQTLSEQNETKGSVFMEWEEEAQPINEQLDDFIKTYRFQRPTSSSYDTLLLNTHNFRSNDIPQYTAQTYKNRLYELPTIISMDYNIYVQRYIEVYTVRRREQVSRMLGLSRVYFPIFESYLDKHGMPMELKYLSVVESALNPHARSRVGATGLWQFMLYTGRQYGLTVNSFVDERKDPFKSTEAAIHYLKDAYAEFGDWLLAIASYNCGMGNVRKAIRRSGNKNSFWEIREFLPRETRGYVPAFIAATYVFENPSAHNLYPVYVDFDMSQDTLHLSRIDITLSEIASLTNTDVQVLKNLNPELKLDRIPYSTKPYVLRVPPVVAEKFAGQERQIYAQYGKKRNQYIPPVAYTRKVSRPSSPPSGPKGSTLVYYTVRSGDVVGTIAEKYGVSSRQIAYWNNLRRYRIRAGQKLKIYTSKRYAKNAGARPVSSSSSSSPSTSSFNRSRAVYHKVKSGDTLWGIAKQYGVNVDGIKTLNRGLNSSRLKIGQSIRVK